MDVGNHAFRGEALECDEVVLQFHRLIPPFGEGLRVGDLGNGPAADVEDGVLGDKRHPRGGRIGQGLLPAFGRIIAEYIRRHRNGVGEGKGGGYFDWLGGGLGRLASGAGASVADLDEELPAEGVGDLVLAGF